MTIAANMIVTTDQEGKKYLAGTLRFDLKANAMLILRKNDDGTYRLVALSGDGRTINRDPSTLASFCDIPDGKPKQQNLFTRN